MHPYDYSVSESRFEVSPVAATSQWSHCTVTFPAAFPAKYAEGNTVYGDYFAPACSGQSPLAILVPGLGDLSLTPCLLLARHLVRQGIASLVLYLVFHSRRLPSALKGQFLPPNAKEWLGIYQSSVADIRKLLDWAQGRPEIDSKRIGVTGISLGGMVAAIAMALDRRVSGGAFVVTGGNLEAISWGGAGEIIRTGHDCTREECRQVYRHYPRYLANTAQNGIENVAPARECFLFDPLTFAPHLRGRPVLMINAEQDEIIPQQAALEFWEACGKPPLKWLPANHTTIYSHIPLIAKEVAVFLKGISGSDTESC